MSEAVTPPKDQFEVYAPSEAQPFDDRWVSHLLRRAGFGASVDQLDRFAGKTPGEVLDWLFDFDASQDPLAEQFESLVGFVNTNNPQPIQDWWIFRMLNSPRPLQEKVALFWHNRFATSLGKVEQPMLMHQQIDLFRRQGLGNYRTLLISVGRDPAMLVWLDGRTSRKGKPNENYGRELMELFTLGIGNYTEKDVQELARAFTGWELKDGVATFNEKNFDSGEKTVLGQKGKFDSESAIDVILAQPAAPKHLVERMLCEFVHPEPTSEQIEHYAKRAVDLKWELRPLLREILASRMFFSEWAYRSKIKSPMELVIGASHAIGGKVSCSYLREVTSKMGQNLMYPPSVKGWDGQRVWINANTVLLRFNVGLSLATQNKNNEFVKRAELEAYLASHNLRRPEEIVDHFARTLLDGKVSEEAKEKLVAYMFKGGKGDGKDGMMMEMSMSKSQAANPKVRGMLHLLMSMPEFQLA